MLSEYKLKWSIQQIFIKKKCIFIESLYFNKKVKYVLLKKNYKMNKFLIS